ncbi:MAG: hypothetical protein PHN69_02140 [Candidatus Pacebacteria bacterium]|nr:hypothetical protein [Candidatus Paceibacterota bacterium]
MGGIKEKIKKHLIKDNLIVLYINMNLEQPRKENIENDVILKIDRSGKSIHDDNGVFTGEIFYEDQRSLTLDEIDTSKIKFVKFFKPDQTQEINKILSRLNFLKEDENIHLDAKILKTLLEHEELIPETWKEEINGHTRYIAFDGTILYENDSEGHFPKKIPCLFWNKKLNNGCWDFKSIELEYFIPEEDLIFSAVL